MVKLDLALWQSKIRSFFWGERVSARRPTRLDHDGANGPQSRLCNALIAQGAFNRLRSTLLSFSSTTLTVPRADARPANSVSSRSRLEKSDVYSQSEYSCNYPWHQGVQQPPKTNHDSQGKFVDISLLFCQKGCGRGDNCCPRT